MTFEEAFRADKTDKLLHGYYEYYEELIGKDPVNSVLEIGILNGSSLKAWQKVWPFATIEGVELDKIPEHISDMFTVYRHDSTNVHNAKLLNKTYDLIVDDAAHHWKNQLATFNNYYEKANKYYVIEDLLGEYGQNKLLEHLPKDVISKSKLYVSKGPTRTFTHSGHTEKDATYRILLIKK